MLSPVIIIGAGAAGLLAARELSLTGFPVTILEAAAAPGGRIHTIGSAEAGAEFIHGELPLSLRLAKEAGIPVHPVRSDMNQVRKGKWGEEGAFTNGWDELMKRMAALQQDLPIARFLEKEFSDEKYSGLRDSVRRFAEGYDLADLQHASTKAIYREWSHEGEEEEYRLEGGYRRLIDHLIAQCRMHNVLLHCSSAVSHIRWEKGRVEVMTTDGRSFTADKLILTPSLGVWQKMPPTITPAIPAHLQAIHRLGYGTVIKILLEFQSPFWHKKKPTGRTLFILSDEGVPTWWTQAKDNNTILTGWLAGNAMRTFQTLDPEARLDSCLRSLASIFSLDIAFLRAQLLSSHIVDWSDVSHIYGGYSYETVGSEAARAILSTPVEETLYFAGEAFYSGSVPATVEAAFHSGRTAALRLMASTHTDRASS